MQVEIKDNQIVISLPISPHPSKSGKTTVIASTAGNQPTTCLYNNKPVILGVNAYVAK